MNRVLILYKFLPQYRQDFFEKLRTALQKEGIVLDLIYGKLKNKDLLKKDEVEIPWATYVANKTFHIAGNELIWQPCIRNLKGTELVIVEQANKLLLNYYLMFARKFSHYRFAHWGHGRNMQDNPNSLKNKFKYLYLKQCDWWFAYTQGVKGFLVSQGYPEHKITVVQNAIDTLKLKQQLNEVTESDLEELRNELGIAGSNVAIYCGGMYREKRIDFILDVCKKVKHEIPDFHMLFIGSGIESVKVAEAASNHPWIHYFGPKFGADRIKYFKLASVQLMPGLVGLGILDSFALETPIVTTTYPYHSPEIEYLVNNVNGIITEDNRDDYCNKIIELMKTRNHLTLIEGCRHSSTMYTVEAMVENFKNGIISCLDSGKGAMRRSAL